MKDNKYPLVSIIVPVYNVSSYILKCLDSIYNQSYTNFEVIIIDDCGIDDSMRIIEKYLTPERSIITTIIHHDKNKGLSAARNTGIQNAKCEWIYFLDSDDYLSPHCIESFVNIVQQHQEVDVIFGTAQFIPYEWKECNISVNFESIPKYSQNRKWINKSFFVDESFPITAWNKLIKKEYITRNNLFFKEGIIYEDNLWYWHIGNTVNSIAFNKEITYFYRYVPNSIINKPYNKRNMNSEVIIIKEMSKSITYRHFLSQFIYILHYSHSSYCKRLGNNPLPPSYIRYPKAFLFFLKCILMKPEQLRKNP